MLDPEEVKADPHQWRRIGEEVSDSLDYEPARLLGPRLISTKNVPWQGVDVVSVIAPLLPILQERCVAAPRLQAAMPVATYCDHLLLYRKKRSSQIGP